jgi:D-hexose-6-phosphate mutarotase
VFDPLNLAEVSKFVCNQYRVIKQILRKPELRDHVQSFRWTMGLENYCRLSHRISNKVACWNHQEVFQMFAHLKNVSTVKIDGVDKHTYPVPEINELFPKSEQSKEAKCIISLHL